eukprot:scaffold6753_cov20-Prasinocladus_malaysianus.AAC.3
MPSDSLNDEQAIVSFTAMPSYVAMHYTLSRRFSQVISSTLRKAAGLTKGKGVVHKSYHQLSSKGVVLTTYQTSQTLASSKIQPFFVSAMTNSTFLLHARFQWSSTQTWSFCFVQKIYQPAASQLREAINANRIAFQSVLLRHIFTKMAISFRLSDAKQC